MVPSRPPGAPDSVVWTIVRVARHGEEVVYGKRAGAFNEKILQSAQADQAALRTPVVLNEKLLMGIMVGLIE